MSGRRPANILVVNDAGGVGKTLLAALLIRARRDLRALTFDVGAGHGRSKLARLLEACGRPDVIDLVAEARPTSIIDVDDSLLPFVGLGDHLALGGTLVDVGSRRALALADWGREAGAAEFLVEQGVPTLLFVPVVATAQSVLLGRSAIEALGGRDGFFGLRPFLVLNEVHGSFDVLRGDENLAWLNARCEEGRMRVMKLARCAGGVLPFVENGRLSIDEAMTIEPERFAELANISVNRSVWWLRCFAEFVGAALQGFEEAGLVPKPRREEMRVAFLDDRWNAIAERTKAELVDRIQVVVGGASGESDVLEGVSKDDAAFLGEAFPDVLRLVAREVRTAAMRGKAPDIREIRRGAIDAAHSILRQAEVIRRNEKIEPRLGPYRRDIVLAAAKGGIDPAGFPVAVASYVYDLQDLGLWGTVRATGYLLRMSGEALLVKVGLKRERAWPPRLH